MDIKILLAVLGDACLDAEVNGPGDFNGTDLVQAVLSLTHVSHSISFQRTDLNDTQRIALCKEFGRVLHQIIKGFTDIDTRLVVRESSTDILDAGVIDG